ncbi:hypothetical protein [Streptosporangium lutulentum]|uniref:Uncharacterized protein n=1 Tax=Streptosporangium lutulentum TaxID=1461250 RepID=A0ABT9QDI6_9ACTN|nr:hypothetical protein [Streptosporangium lutulentum]MDP9844383.1 hypothetical protein [Streptosporangium lutulentum]
MQFTDDSIAMLAELSLSWWASRQSPLRYRPSRQSSVRSPLLLE